MTTKGKRPMRALTPGDKIEAIQRVNDGESKASVARNIGVPESTLRGWCKNENKLRYMSSRISSPETDKSNDGEIPEKRARTESPAVAPRSPAATGLDLSSPAIVSQSSQPVTVATDSPIELTTKKNDPPPAQYVPRERRQDPGASVSMSAISPLSGLSFPGLTARTGLGPSLNDIATNLSLLAQLNPGLYSITAQNGSRGLRSVRSPKPAHIGMAHNLNETRHRSRSNHTSDPYRYGNPRSCQPSTSQASPAQTLDEAMLCWISAQQAMLGLSHTASSYAPLHLGTSSDPTLSKPVAPVPASSLHMDYNRNSLIQEYYKQLGGAMALPIDRLRSASQVPKEQSADNILYSQLTKGKTENGRASSSPVQNQSRRSEVSATITSPREQHVVQPAISPEVGVENKEPAAEKPIESGRSHPRGRNVLDNLLFNNLDTTTDYANVIGSTNGESQESYAEALEHGDKFLAWLESSRDPSVTHIHVHQLRGLLHNLRTRRGLPAAAPDAHRRK